MEKVKITVSAEYDPLVVSAKSLRDKLFGMVEMAQECHEDNFPCTKVSVELAK